MSGPAAPSAAAGDDDKAADRSERSVGEGERGRANIAGESSVGVEVPYQSQLGALHTSGATSRSCKLKVNNDARFVERRQRVLVGVVQTLGYGSARRGWRVRAATT